MNQALLSSYSGIKTHQFGIDSISNNIANVNTTGYRESVPEFETLYAPPSATSGTPTSNEVNMGVKAASNAISTKSGSYRLSDGEFDMAYEGKGWFVVGENKEGELEVTDGKMTQKQKNFFTRDGSFGKDHSGYLVNSQGYYVYGVNLGKIKDGIFMSESQESDLQKLASGKLSPLQIPQDLHYRPLETTKVDLSVNLNKTQNPASALKAFGVDGKFDSAKALQADMGVFFANGKAFDPSLNKEGIITITTPQGESKTYTFAYGTGGEGANEFKTLEELQKLIKDQTGLDLKLNEESDRVSLDLSNALTPESKIQTSGTLFEFLGMVDSKDGFNALVQVYDPNQTYEPNQLVAYHNVIFRKIDVNGSNNPIMDPKGWEIADTSNVPNYQEGKNYQAGDVVLKDGNVYVKEVGEENQFAKIGEAKTMQTPTYDAQSQYGTNTAVNYDGKLYKRIGALGNSNPAQDSQNWQEITSGDIRSVPLEVASYQSNVEVFDTDGKRYRLVSDFYHTGGFNPQDKTSQKWEVSSYIADFETGTPIGKSVSHTISFDEENKPNAQEVTLDFLGKELKYNIAGTPERKSSDMIYAPSQISAFDQNGRAEGTLQNVAIDDNGVIFLKFSNGVQEAMGRIGVMTFTNDQGLEKMGGNLFGLSSTLVNGEAQNRSGKPILGWNENGKLQFGKVKSGYLETSNVDVGNALTELILMQRGYSMNAKTFTTGDELIKEAINLKK
ncbi:hypothetical protein BBW65_00270 [Helicobacter enhydrae]|uniref:Uncharacterized protein n=1 Tax=Helicobacter enhydrae TaxID=222136 RepID=A0A1B1U3M5_9HELI|nr:flagellar hook-basal body complex protein [Helicobacter enhydrae]ANV97348.1 hypothetical protein BBW65_00270 [Helicobacter enhydrae]